MSSLVRCPDFRGCNVHNGVFGTAKCALFIDVSSFQGVLIREDLLYLTTETDPINDGMSSFRGVLIGGVSLYLFRN